jgi:nucleotide-binding universal stress UspA family protein
VPSELLPTFASAKFSKSIKRILVPTELTDESEGAIEAGVVLAKSFGAQLTLLHVYEATREPEISYLVGRYAVDALVEDRKYCEYQLKATAEEIRKRYPASDTEFREGVPCEEIVNTATERDIDIIIISTHNYNWLTRLAYGCDAERILRAAPCPILVLHSNNEGLAVAKRCPVEKVEKTGPRHPRYELC